MDFRLFLKERLQQIQDKNPNFSHRAFNRMAGIKSPGFLKLVLEGKRQLTDATIRSIARGFKLNQQETNYFTSLVKFNQSETEEEKDMRFKELSQNKQFKAAKPMTAAQYQLFSHWYYVAILELVRLEIPGAKNVEWLHYIIQPEVELKNLKTAVKDLKQLGLLKEDKSGRLDSTEAMLTTDEAVASLSVANFHHQMSGLASRVVMTEPADKREFSALTIALSPKAMEIARQEIQNFNKKLHSMLEQETTERKTLVAHINLQLFQLSKGTP